MFPSRDHHEQFVQKTFDRIAQRYDLLNRIISFHVDTLWRKQVIKALELKGSDKVVLDIGTGTGDLALAAARATGKRGRVVGLDFSPKMLRLAQAKKRKVPYGQRALYVLGNALIPPFKEGTFDAIMTTFVLRNISDLDLFFFHAHRLLRPGGKIASLDMFPPSSTMFGFFYSIYFYHLVPWIGASIGRDRDAYQYLSDSVRTFDPPETVAGLIQQAGFGGVRIQKFLRGAVCLHVGKKPFL